MKRRAEHTYTIDPASKEIIMTALRARLNRLHVLAADCRRISCEDSYALVMKQANAVSDVLGEME